MAQVAHGGEPLLRNLVPDLILNSVADLDLDMLEGRGVEALLVDLDNTLCRWKREEVSETCDLWVARARERFRMCIVSNSIHPQRLKRVADRLGIAHVGRWGLGRKPCAGGIRAALKLTDAAPEQAAMVGDQIMTDVLGGNRMGLFTVWVKPLSSGEFAGTKPARLIETLLIPGFRRRGMLPEGWED